MGHEGHRDVIDAVLAHLSVGTRCFDGHWADLDLEDGFTIVGTRVFGSSTSTLELLNDHECRSARRGEGTGIF